MNKRFKIIKFLRVIVIVILIIIVFHQLSILYRYLMKGLLISYSLENLPSVIISIVILYCAISLNKTEYNIGNDFLTIKDFLRKDRKYSWSQIIKIQEKEAWPFKYIKIFFKDKKTRNIAPLDNQNEFIKIVKEKITSEE